MSKTSILYILMNPFKYCIFIIILLFSLSVYAQPNEVYNWFDSQINIENTPLYNGVEFRNTYNILNNNHRFYETDAYITGDVRYNNQMFFNVPLRYDLYEDQLIVKIENSRATNEILLLKERVESFRIGTAHFEKLDAARVDSNITPGYYQVLTENENFKLYKKMNKKINQRIRDRRVFYEFNSSKPEYVVQTQDSYFELNSMRDLTSRYPEHRNELSNFRLTSRDYKSNDAALVSAITRLNTLINN